MTEAQKMVLIQEKANEMLDELLRHRLEVVLVAAPEEKHSGHKIRLVCDQNAKWYREFCALYSGTRKQGHKVRTYIHRPTVVKHLSRIAQNLSGAPDSIYKRRLVEFIVEKLRLEPRPEHPDHHWHQFGIYF